MTDDEVAGLNLGSRETARLFSGSVGKVENNTLGIYDICNTKAEWEALAEKRQRTLWSTNGAECVLREKWVCEATISNDQETRTVEFMEDVIAQIPVSYPTEDSSRRTHEVIKEKTYEGSAQMLYVETIIWVDEEPISFVTEVAFLNGKPAYQ